MKCLCVLIDFGGTSRGKGFIFDYALYNRIGHNIFELSTVPFGKIPDMTSGKFKRKAYKIILCRLGSGCGLKVYSPIGLR